MSAATCARSKTETLYVIAFGLPKDWGHKSLVTVTCCKSCRFSFLRNTSCQCGVFQLIMIASFTWSFFLCGPKPQLIDLTAIYSLFLCDARTCYWNMWLREGGWGGEVVAREIYTRWSIKISQGCTSITLVSCQDLRSRWFTLANWSSANISTNKTSCCSLTRPPRSRATRRRAWWPDAGSSTRCGTPAGWEAPVLRAPSPTGSFENM